MTVHEIFGKEKIEYVSALDITSADIRRPDLIGRRGMSADEIKCALVFLMPYYVDDGNGNVSLYARPRDYHAYTAELFPRLEAALTNEFGGRFFGFADKSPIEETSAALRAGLCVRGDSYVIINEKYGSFVFIGEVLTDVPAEKMGLDGTPKKAGECLYCGACRRACPMKNGRDCLSAVTQKKGELTDDEKAYIIENGSVWGCDICQTVCPMNQNVAETPIPFFRENRISRLDGKTLEQMTDEEFMRRAFSWRKKETVARNVALFENAGK